MIEATTMSSSSKAIEAECALTPVHREVTDSEIQKKDATKRVVTLGSIRHRHEDTGEVILIPTPSNDPNDPLNWYYTT